MLRCHIHPDREAIGQCGRCGRPFCGEDRRVQPRGGDLCRPCHLDPRARALPVELDDDRSFARRCIGTLWQLLSTPNASFRRVREPVEHSRVVGFLLAVRLPLWAVLIVALTVRWVLTDDPVIVRPRGYGYVLDANLGEALSTWLLLLVPIGLPLLYFLGGVVAHGAIVLSGGATRSLGASMRAFGYCAAWPLLGVSVLDLFVHFGHASPEVYAAILGVMALWQYILLSLALARTHGIRLVRGFAAAPLAVALFAGVVLGRALLELPYMPFVERTVDPMLPYLPYIP